MQIPNTEEIFWSRIKKTDTCWLFQVAPGNKLKTHATIGYKGKKWDVHRLAWTFTNGDIPDGLFVLHKCDVGICCNPDHLFLGTAKDNTQDMHKKGRWCDRKGHKNPHAKFTPEQIVAIRQSLDSISSIADYYGVDYTTIRMIVRKKSYTNIADTL